MILFNNKNFHLKSSKRLKIKSRFLFSIKIIRPNYRMHNRIIKASKKKIMMKINEYVFNNSRKKFETLI